jgi:DNA modification methylase
MEDRTQSDLWTIARPKRSDEHPTMKPVELVVRAIKNSSVRGAIVFEPFSGSGTTLIASEASGRACRAIELEPKYVQVAIERWEKLTGRKATKCK